MARVQYRSQGSSLLNWLCQLLSLVHSEPSPSDIALCTSNRYRRVCDSSAACNSSSHSALTSSRFWIEQRSCFGMLHSYQLGLLAQSSCSSRLCQAKLWFRNFPTPLVPVSRAFGGTRLWVSIYLATLVTLQCVSVSTQSSSSHQRWAPACQHWQRIQMSGWSGSSCASSCIVHCSPRLLWCDRLRQV